MEHLPNELLIYIFQFLSPVDLHRSFYNQNLRLNTICCTQKLYLDLSWTKRSFDYYCSNQQPFAPQIYSLKLDDSYDRLRLVNLYVDVGLFANLRVLIIQDPSSENFGKISNLLMNIIIINCFNFRSNTIKTTYIITSVSFEG